MKKEKWEGKIIISDPASLLNEIANRYQSTERVFMEFIDNSLDDAEDLLQENKGEYPYPIEISIMIDSKRGQIIFRDNCRGMDWNTLIRVTQRIGESKKKGVPWLNGRFGFGVHAFRAICNKIVFRTRNKKDEFYDLVFTRSQFQGIKPPEVLTEKFPTKQDTGTEVILSEFEPGLFEEITVESIQKEIELHFERLLARKKLEVKISIDNNKPVQCLPFDYEKISGKEFHKIIPVPFSSPSAKFKPNVEIYLKVTETITHRRPAFFNKGRRIAEMKYIRSFMTKSKYRTSLWDHDNLVGFVESNDLARPVITRDDFVRDRGRGLFYDMIMAIEDELKAAVDEITKKYESHSFNTLEDVLSKVLRKLAREDALKFRTVAISIGGDESLLEDGGSILEEGHGGHYGETSGGGGEVGGGEETGKGPSGEGEGGLPGEGQGGPRQEISPTDTQFTGKTRRQSGFNIKFVNLPELSEDKPVRSQFNDGTISINIAHPDFKNRLDRLRTGELKITHRLLGYLACVVSIHYKDQYYEKYKNQPEARNQLFDEQVEFICRLEDALAPNIRELGEAISEEIEEIV